MFGFINYQEKKTHLELKLITQEQYTFICSDCSAGGSYYTR